MATRRPEQQGRATALLRGLPVVSLWDDNQFTAEGPHLEMEHRHCLGGLPA